MLIDIGDGGVMLWLREGATLGGYYVPVRSLYMARADDGIQGYDKRREQN